MIPSRVLHREYIHSTVNYNIKKYITNLKLVLNHEMMKIYFVDNRSQETYLADISIRCSNPLNHGSEWSKTFDNHARICHGNSSPYPLATFPISFKFVPVMLLIVHSYQPLV